MHEFPLLIIYLEQTLVLNVVNLFGVATPLYMGAQLQIIDTKTHNIDNKEGGN